MQLTDTQLTYFVDHRVKLPGEQREKHLRQVSNLISEFRRVASDDPKINVQKFLFAGSLMKGTSLRPRDGYSPDADIAVFLLGEAGGFDIELLHERIRRLLLKCYPTKQPSDFTVQPRTLGIVFQGSGLEVDLVPIIPDPKQDDFGYQPSSRGEPPILTSVAGQLDFIRKRKDADPRFAKLVRMVKYWRNHHELDDLRSFVIELLLAHLQDQRGAAPSLEEGLLRFFSWVAQTELGQPVTFPECGQPTSWPKDRMVILDPVNVTNNVARRMTEPQCREIVNAARTAWERIHEARNNDFVGETVECWKDVFGRSFVIEGDA
jgi:hypothetical protein